MSVDTDLYRRLEGYFARPVAEQAARPLADGALIELRVQEADGRAVETFTFSRQSKANHLAPQGNSDAQIVFILTPGAVDELIDNANDDVAQTGVQILKLILSQDASRKIRVKLNSGFLTLWNKGYLGVMTAAGGDFTKFLASRGLSGMDAIKAAIKGLKG